MFTHNMPFSNNSVYNNKQWVVSHAVNLGNTHHSTRYTKEVIAYANNASIPHQTIPGLIQGTYTMFITRGTQTTKWYWPEGDSPSNCNTSTAIANFKTQLSNINSRHSNSTNVTVTSETANSITITVDFAHDDYSYRDVTDWYVPDSSKSTTTFSNNATCVCWMNVNGTQDYYTAKLTDIQEGVQRTFKKFDNECYILFSANVVTDSGTTLNQFQVYKMTSDTITATPSANGKAIYYHGQPD